MSIHVILALVLLIVAVATFVNFQDLQSTVEFPEQFEEIANILFT